MNPIILDVIGVLARAVLLAATGYLQRQHLLTPEQSEQFIASVLADIAVWAPGLVAVVWGLWKAWHSRRKLLVAAAAGRPMSENEVKAAMRTAAPSVSTPKDTVPVSAPV